MSLAIHEASVWLGPRINLVLPLVLTGWIAWGDLRTRRIPNYLTVGIALSGLIFNFINSGFNGLGAGVLGMLLGFAFLILPYILGGMGAGDVKALAALGAWLGPTLTVVLFCYMGIAGGVMAVGYLAWKGLLWQKIRQGWIGLVNLILCRPDGRLDRSKSSIKLTEGIPYGVAIALGMVLVCWRGM